MNGSQLMLQNVAHDLYNRRLCIVETLTADGVGWSFLAKELPEDTPFSIRAIVLDKKIMKAIGMHCRGQLFGHPRIPLTLIQRNGMFLVKMKQDGAAITSVKYLHELQNLFFIIAGDQLPIDLAKLEMAVYGPIKENTQSAPAGSTDN